MFYNMDTLMTMLEHPAELLAIARLKLTSILPEIKPIEDLSAEALRCQQLLRMTGRTFAAVILSLDPVIRDPLTVLYLTLRALDTVEDDLNLDIEVRRSMLLVFHEHLEDPTWSFHESQDKDAVLLREFPIIYSQYKELEESYRTIITGVCKEMGEGMSNQLNKPIISLKQYDKYCNYASGIVYRAATRMFVASGLEPETLSSAEELSCHLGLFLQKTNIIRDYLDDVNTGRHYWPKEIWGRYVDKLSDLSLVENTERSVQCLNELVTNSLHHIPHVLQYLSTLTNPSVFRSCALPMVMAIATIERCYNNEQVFRGVVKIRKGEAVRLMTCVNNISDVRQAFSKYLRHIKSRVPQSVLVTSLAACSTVSLTAAGSLLAAASPAATAVVDCWTVKTIQRLLGFCSNHNDKDLHSNRCYDRNQHNNCCHGNVVHSNNTDRVNEICDAVESTSVTISNKNFSTDSSYDCTNSSAIILSNEKHSDGSNVVSISWSRSGEEEWPDKSCKLSINVFDLTSVLLVLVVVWRLYLAIIYTLTTTQ